MRESVRSDMAVSEGTSDKAMPTSVLPDTKGSYKSLAEKNISSAFGRRPDRRPLIGVSPRWSPADEQFCASESLGELQVNAILAAGGLPVMLPITHDIDIIRQYVEMCDGFNIPGGQSVDSSHWGEPLREGTDISPERDGFEFPLVQMVLEADKPLLAICRGEQLLNVVCGGTICQWLYDLEPSPGMATWRHAIILDRPAHPVDVQSDTLLFEAVGKRSLIQTNSSHHECVAKLGSGLIASARATDGIIEGLEMPGKRFVVGVQWHPEYTWQSIETDRMLWEAFVRASRASRDERAS